jgi:YHS domain-containing protein
MQHRGKTYLFAGPQELALFQANPDRYVPALSGNDPVLEMDRRQSVPGNLMFGVVCRGRIYLFASEETLQQFEGNQNRYATGSLQARAPDAPPVTTYQK